MAGNGQLGTLTIDVLANIADMVSDLGHAQEKNAEAAEKFREQWESSIEAVQESFKKLAELAGVAISVEAFKEIIESSLEAAEQVSNMSKAFGFSTQAIQTMGFAAAMVGGNLEEATGAMAHLEKSATEAASGNVQAAEAFRSIGINASQLAELLKNPDELLQTVSEHMAEFGNGTGKTAAAMQIFGRGAASIIPMLEELGEGFDKLKTRAEGFGVVLSTQDEAAFLEANEQFDLLKEAAVGAGNQFTAAMLPAINAVTEALVEFADSGAITSFFHTLGEDIAQTVELFSQLKEKVGEIGAEIGSVLPSFENPLQGMRMDVAGMVADFMNDLDRLLTGFKNFGPQVMIGFEVTWAAIANGFSSVVSWVLEQLSTLASKEAQLFANVPLAGAATKSLQALSNSLDQTSKSFQQVTPDIDKWIQKISDNNAELKVAQAENNAWYESTLTAAGAIRTFTNGLGEFQASLTKGDVAGNLAKLKAASDNIHETAEQLIKDGQNEEKVNAAAANSIQTLTKMVTAADAAQVKYDSNAKQHADTVEKLNKDYVEMAKFLDGLASTLDGEYTKAWESYGAEIDTARAMAVKFAHDGMSAVQTQQFLATATDLARAKLVEHTDAEYLIDRALSQANTEYAQQAQLLGLTGTALEVETEYQKLLNAALKEMQGLMGPLTEADQARIQSLHGVAEAMVAGKEAQTAYTAALKDWENIASSGFDSVGKSIADFATGSIKNWHDFGQSLVDDTKQFIAAIIAEMLKLLVFNGIMNSVLGTNLSTGLGSLASLGSSAASGAANSAGSSLLSNGGSLASAGGNLLGLGGSQSLVGSLFGTGDFDVGIGNALSSGGGLTGALGTIGGAFAGYEIGKQLTGSTAGGIAGGIGLGVASYFIPVIGWIAGAATLINTLTGGGLFGTSYKPTGNTGENVSIGAGGADISAYVEESKKKALFQGRSWKDVTVAAPDDAVNAVNTMYAQIQKSLAAGAAALGEQVPDVISASFKQTFDKSGKLTSNISTVLGQTYSETIDEFAQRIAADSALQLLPAEATQIAQAWQSSAATLASGVAFLLQAQVDIKNGNALVQGDTLTQLTSFVTGMEAQGEDLSTTYTRLQQETMTVNAIFDTLGVSTGKTGEALVTFDDQLVQLAGGINNLATAANTYYTEYYSASEQAANTLKALQTNVTNTFKAIGEDPSVSMAQFRADFEAAMPTLTPQQILEWYAAGDALYKLNQDLGQTAQSATDAAAARKAQTDYNDFISGFKDTYTDDFISAMNQVGQSLSDNITKANQLAVAAGMAGASTEDLATILQSSVLAAVAQIKQEESNAEQLVEKLFGTPVDKLNKQLASWQAKLAALPTGDTTGTAYGLSAFYQQQIDSTQAQIDAANKQAQAAQNFSDASSLVQDFADIGAASGQGLGDFLSKYGISQDQLAGFLNTNADGLQNIFNQDEQNALAALQTATNSGLMVGYLADIRSILGGQPISSIGYTTPTVPPNLGIQPRSGAATPQNYFPSLGGTQTNASDASPVQVTFGPDAMAVLSKLVSVGESGNESNQTALTQLAQALAGKTVQGRARNYAGPRSVVLTP